MLSVFDSIENKTSVRSEPESKNISIDPLQLRKSLVHGLPARKYTTIAQITNQKFRWWARDIIRDRRMAPFKVEIEC